MLICWECRTAPVTRQGSLCDSCRNTRLAALKPDLSFFRLKREAGYQPRPGDRVHVRDVLMDVEDLGTVREICVPGSDPLVTVVLDKPARLTQATEVDTKASRLTKLRTPPDFASQEEADAWLAVRPCALCGDPDDHDGSPHGSRDVVDPERRALYQASLPEANMRTGDSLTINVQNVQIS